MRKTITISIDTPVQIIGQPKVLGVDIKVDTAGIPTAEVIQILTGILQDQQRQLISDLNRLTQIIADTAKKNGHN